MGVKLGIALGGGGARGLAHLGVLKVLEEEGIPVHCIAGCSVGAVVGAAYAQHPGADILVERFKASLDESFFSHLGLAYLNSDCSESGSFLHQAARRVRRRLVINLAQSREAILKEGRLREVLSRLIDAGRIEETRLSLAVVATSLDSGREVVFRKGDVIDAVAASSAVPAFLSPVRLEGDLLTDGAVACPVPVRCLASMGADVSLAVEISVRKFFPLEPVNVFEILNRAGMITSRELGRAMARTADVAIFPDTRDVHWADFSRFDELIRAGMEATRESLPRLKAAIRKRRPWYRRIM